MSGDNDILIQFELHSPEGIRRCLMNQPVVVDPIAGENLILALASEYTRSLRFSECVRVCTSSGLRVLDPLLMAVLKNDAGELKQYLTETGDRLQDRFTMRCAYTPLTDVNLLHICAEFNHVSCAEVLLEMGADVNAPAGVDDFGFGGQSPIFHTVNQNGNQSADMMHVLLDHGARLDITVKGLVWGKGYEWETLIPAVNPISYAMMGLLPQMHRDERTITETVNLLLRHAFGIEYTSGNIPNAYLKREP